MRRCQGLVPPPLTRRPSVAHQAISTFRPLTVVPLVTQTILRGFNLAADGPCLQFEAGVPGQACVIRPPSSCLIGYVR